MTLPQAKELFVSSTITQITIFNPHPGQLDAFVRHQVEGLSKLGAVPGSLGSKLYRSLDGQNVIMVSRFESAADQDRFAASAQFAAHREMILPFLESRSGGQYELIYERTPEGEVVAA
ncbi:MAG TPA: antibiotic biosynthesis monooxygenase family protein [Phenylobacterium sp.]|nr:antibiotic biosynthesis monooxygenase family protein [Phenylobacterium sp.]